MPLTLTDIKFKFPGSERRVFDNLSLHVPAPGFHALFGPSGVGKTSLARIITGELIDYSGNVDTDGITNMLYTYNLERLPGWSSVGKHLNRITAAEKQDKKNQILEIFGMKGLIGSRFSQLSLGQQNRINLLRYLLQEFDMLIMDESLANVDEKTRDDIILSIKEMFPQAYFFYISHNVVEVAKYCERIYVLRSAGKNPQIAEINGRDYRGETAFKPRDLDSVMLEIMNVS